MTGQYFATPEAEKAKLIDMMEREKTLKMHLATLNDEFDQRCESWQRLRDAYKSDLGETIYKAGEDTLDIQRPYPNRLHVPYRAPMNTTASLPRKHFDGESLWNLIADREKTKQELKDLRQRLSDAGYASVPF